MSGKCVVFTGHRPDMFTSSKGIVPWDPLLWVPVIDLLELELAAEAKRLLELEQELWVVQGLAEVFDLAAGAATLRVKKHYENVKLVSAQPFAGDSTKFHTRLAQKWHAGIMARSDECPAPISELPWVYAPRNKWMTVQPEARGLWGEMWVNWDGKQGRGTSQTINMGHKAGLKIARNFYTEIGKLLQ